MSDTRESTIKITAKLVNELISSYQNNFPLNYKIKMTNIKKIQTSKNNKSHGYNIFNP